MSEPLRFPGDWTGDEPAVVAGPTFDVTLHDQLDVLPSVAPLIENTLDRRTLNVIAGPPGAGKSLLALALAYAVATGTPWQGRRMIGYENDDQPQRVLYIAGEDAPGIRSRIRALDVAHGVVANHLDVLAHPVNLLDDTEIDRLVDIVGGNLNDPWHAYDLVVLDTLARSMPGADENATRDMVQAVATLDRVLRAREYRGPDGAVDLDDSGGVTLLVVHHSDKSGRGLRGSNVLEAAADTIYQVTSDGTSVRVDRTKRKNGPRTDRHEFAIVPVPAATDLTWPGAVPPVILSAGQIQDRSQRPADPLMSVILSAFAETGATKAELRNAAEMAPATFHRRLNRLVAEGAIENVGTEKRPFYRLPKK